MTAQAKISPELRAKILEANVEEHRKEASYYNTIHTEIFNRYEQARCRKLLSTATQGMERSSACLDIGAGTGNITRKLLDLGFSDITCVDISPEMLAVLEADLHLPKNRLVHSDIDGFLETNSAHFDIITISSVVHHLPEYLTTLSKLFDRLRPDGVLLITHEPRIEPERGGLSNLAVKLVRKADYSLYAGRYALLLAAGKLKYVGRDCSIADYHTGERALDSGAILQLFAGHQVTYSEYATGRFSLTAWALNQLTADNFQIVVRKNSL